MPRLIIADPNGTASVLGMEAIGALGRGDTALAQQKHGEAGRVLERRMKAVSRAREKHYLRFLAATQFYKGGHYQHAAELAEKIDPKLLDARARELLPNFLTDIRDRSGAGYAPRIGTELKALWEARDWNGLLATLADHQYVLPTSSMAYTRAMACLHLGKLRTAAVFFALAYRDVDVERRYLNSTVAFPVLFAQMGHFDEAAEFLVHLNELFPGPLVSTSIAVVSFLRWQSAEEPKRAALAAEVLDAMSDAWASYQLLPFERREDVRARQHLAVGLGAAALTCLWLGQSERAREYRAIAIRLDREQALAVPSWFENPPTSRANDLPVADGLTAALRRLAERHREADQPAFPVAA